MKRRNRLWNNSPWATAVEVLNNLGGKATIVEFQKSLESTPGLRFPVGSTIKDIIKQLTKWKEIESNTTEVWVTSPSFGNPVLPPDNLLVRKLRDKVGLTDEQIVGVLNVVGSVCHHCLDSEHPCHCENDE